MKQILLIVITFILTGCGLAYQMFKTPKSGPREYQVDEHTLYLEYFNENNGTGEVAKFGKYSHGYFNAPVTDMATKQRHTRVKWGFSPACDSWHSIGSIRAIPFPKSGFIIFTKSGILPETIDKFEAGYDGRITKIYLHTTDTYGSHREYAGETENHQNAMEWVREVNQIYFNRKGQELSEAA